MCIVKWIEWTCINNEKSLVFKFFFFVFFFFLNSCKAFIGVYTAYDAKQMIHKLNQLKWHGLKLNVAFSTRVKKNPSYGAGERCLVLVF